MKTLVKSIIAVLTFSLLLCCTPANEFYQEDADSGSLKSFQDKTQSHGLDQERYVAMKTLDLKVHYRIIGKGPIDVVFIPGWTNPLTVYTRQFDYFRDKARCIYIDLPGTGLSDSPTPGTPYPVASGHQYNMELMADAVYAVVKKEGLHTFVGVGFSMGPCVLGMFERNYPDMISKLVVIDGGFSPWPSDPAERQALIDLREQTYQGQLLWDENIKAMVGASLIPPTLTGDDAEQLKLWGDYFTTFPSDVLANTYYHLSAENANEPVGWQYPKLCFYSKPLADINTDAVDWIYPNNTVYGFPDGGHVIHWIFHEEINPLIWNFIKDQHPGMKGHHQGKKEHTHGRK